jgi:DNA polymerase-3 subunit alpha
VDRVASDRNKTASGQISFFEIVKDDSFDHYDYRDIKEYELGEKLQYEKEVAGVYLTGHPLDQYKEHLKKFKYNVASLFEKTESAEEGEEAEYTIPDDTLVTIGGMIVEAGKRLAKKSGKEFGVGKLEDLYGTVELMLAGFKYNQYKSLFVKDKLVTVTGRVRRRDENISITVDRIETWDSDVKKGASKKICFCISFTQVDESIIDILQNILKAYPGEDMTYIKNLDDNKIYSMGIGTNINPIMYTELCGLIGETNIKIAE